MTARFRPKITLAETKVDWHHPTHIRFGPGRIKELPEVCWQWGISAPLIVTDQGVAKLPFVKSIIRLNKEESIFTTVFSDIFSEPDFDTVKKGAEVLRQGRHDGIIAIGGMFKVHHGRVMGTLLPYVLMLNQTRIKDKMARAARYLDLPGQDFTAFVNWVTDLKIAMGMPANLKELGIRKQHIPDIAQKALEDANIHTNPVKMDPKKMKDLLAHALTG